MTTVLVTGASGFAAGHLIQHLADCGGTEIVGWSRSTATAPDGVPATRWDQVDLADRARVHEALVSLQPDVVYHCAGYTQVGDSWSDPAAPLAANVMATHYLLDGLRRGASACKVLITGSAMVYAPAPRPVSEDDPLAPASPYTTSKLAQEQLGLRALREDGIAVILTRSFNHTGPRQTPAFVAPSIARQIAAIERGHHEPVIRVGNIDTERDLSDVRDVVRAYTSLIASGHPGTIYNVASGVGRSIRSVLEALVARSRVPVRIETDPARVRAKDAASIIGDASRLRDTTGWQPRIAFDQTLDDLLEYWRARE